MAREGEERKRGGKEGERRRGNMAREEEERERGG